MVVNFLPVFPSSQNSEIPIETQQTYIHREMVISDVNWARNINEGRSMVPYLHGKHCLLCHYYD